MQHHVSVTPATEASDGVPTPRGMRRGFSLDSGGAEADHIRVRRAGVGAAVGAPRPRSGSTASSSHPVAGRSVSESSTISAGSGGAGVVVAAGGGAGGGGGGGGGGAGGGGGDDAMIARTQSPAPRLIRSG